MRHLFVPVVALSLLGNTSFAQTQGKPLPVKIVQGEGLKRDNVPTSRVYEVKETSAVAESKATSAEALEDKGDPIAKPVAAAPVTSSTPKPVETPKAKPFVQDENAPVVSNLPVSIRYVGYGELDVTFDVSEPCFLENGFGGVQVWFNDTPMTRVSGALLGSGERYVFRTKITDKTPEGPATLRIRAVNALGLVREEISTQYVVYPYIAQKDLRFVSEESLDIEFAVNKRLHGVPNTEISAFVNGNPMSLLSASPQGEGEKYLFRLPVTKAFGEGLATALFRVRDAAGNVSELETKKIVIDTTPPSITDIRTDTVYQGEGRIRVYATSSEPLTTGLGKSGVSAFLNNRPLTLVNTTYQQGKENYVFEGAVDASFEEGPATITIRAKDIAGNTQVAQHQHVVIDLAKPQVSNVVVQKHYVSSEPFVVQFDLNKDIRPGLENSKLRVLFNTLPMTQLSVTPLKKGARYRYQADIGKNEQQGLAVIQIIATDAVGNTLSQTLDSGDVIVDTITPVVAISPDAGPVTVGTFSVNATFSEVLSEQNGEKKIEAWFNKKRMTIAETTPLAVGEKATFQVKIPMSEQQGPGTFVLRVTDQAGNKTEVSSNTFVVDTIPPVISGIPGEKRRVMSGMLEIGFGVNEKLTLGAGKTMVKAVFNGQDMGFVKSESNEFGNWYTFSTPVSDKTTQGEADIEIYVSDASGNRVTAKYPGIIVDSKPPVLNDIHISVPDTGTSAMPAKKTTTNKKRP